MINICVLFDSMNDHVVLVQYQLPIILT